MKVDLARRGASVASSTTWLLYAQLLSFERSAAKLPCHFLLVFYHGIIRSHDSLQYALALDKKTGTNPHCSTVEHLP